MEVGGGRMDTCVWMAESLPFSPETSTAFLTSYTPMQDKKFKVWEKKKEDTSFTPPLRDNRY